MSEAAVREKLSDAAFCRGLRAMVRSSVPRDEVDEIVQATLVEAIASESAPSDSTGFERWVRGIARHKIADYHRRARREVAVEPEVLASVRASDAAAHDAADLLRWAEREARRPSASGEGARTLEWLLREGDGEKLELVAREEQVPAPRVRQRVARLRRHFRQRWAAQVAAALAFGVVVLAIWHAWYRPRSVAESMRPAFPAHAASSPAPRAAAPAPPAASLAPSSDPKPARAASQPKRTPRPQSSAQNPPREPLPRRFERPNAWGL